MARVTRVEQSDGWTTYSPPEEQLAAARIKGALDAAVHDCRLFARLAREARLQDLPTRLQLTWEQFCIQRLDHPVDVVEAMIAGIEVIGEEVPVPAAVAERVGRALGTREIGVKKGKAGPGRGHKTSSTATRFGRGTDYRLARLDRDHPALAERVRSGEVKAGTAARMAGIIKPPSALKVLRNAWKRATAEERNTFLDEVVSVVRS